jgi:hypothetical protein
MKKKKYGPGGTIEKDPNIKGPIGYLNSYIQSPEFKKRFLQNNIPQDYENAMKLFSESSKKYKPFVLEKDPTDIGSRVGNSTINPYLDKNIPLNANVILSKKQSQELGADLLNDVLPHEYSHTLRKLNNLDNIDFAFRDKSPTSRKLYSKYSESKSDKEYGSWLEQSLPNAHDLKPEEQYSDLNSLRYLMYKQEIYDTRKGPLDLPTLKKALKDPYIKNEYNIKRLLEHFTPEKIVELNNAVAQNNQENSTPMAKSGIHIKPENKGKFTAYKKRTGKTTEEALHSPDPHVRQMANFARNAKKWHHAKEGIDLQDPNYGNIAEGALTAIDMLLPTQNIQQPVIRPIVQTNPLAYGNNSQAIFKKGGKIMYDKGGKTEEKKAVSLNMNKHKTNPDLYSPFGENAQLAYDEGWYPATGKTSSGQVIYNSDYDLLNNVMTPRKSNKGIPSAGGRVQLVGNGNGIFDVNVTDVDGQIFKTLAKGVPFTEANKFITKPSNVVQGRSNQIVDQTTAIPPEPTAKVFGKGGKIAKNGMKISYNEGETYDLHPNEINRLKSLGYQIQHL